MFAFLLSSHFICTFAHILPIIINTNEKTNPYSPWGNHLHDDNECNTEKVSNALAPKAKLKLLQQ